MGCGDCGYLCAAGPGYMLLFVSSGRCPACKRSAGKGGWLVLDWPVATAGPEVSKGGLAHSGP